MNIKHLRAALAVYDLGGISTAAEHVHLSQSAVSQGLKRLEAGLGYALFESSPAGTRVTEGGERFLERLRRGLTHLKTLEETVSRSTGQPAGIVNRCTHSQLLALVEVVEQRSYSRAALALGISQPSVHRAIRSFEALCGTALFGRSPAGAEPYWLARQAARCASLYFAELEQGKDELAESNGSLTGRLRIGALPLARASIVPAAIARLLDAYPECRVSILDGPYHEQLRQLLNGQVDVIVGALRDPEPSPSLRQEHLFSDPLRVVTRVGHPLADRAAHSMEELQALKWIAPSPATPAREAFAHFFEAAGLPLPSRVIECSSLTAIRSLLLLTDYAALLPALQVERDVGAGLLALSPQRLPGTTRDIGFAFQKAWQPTVIQRYFLDLVRSLVRQMALTESQPGTASLLAGFRVP